MLVKEKYNLIDLNILKANTNKSDYYLTELEFVQKVYERDVNTLTEKQTKWLEKISKRFE